jgi:tellurite resistance protein
MKESRDYLEMSFQSINCFADDGKLDADELMKIFEIAKRDGVVDENERRVLRNIISRVTPEELTPEMKEVMKTISLEVLG